MADVRLIALALVAACGRADAQPPATGLKLPAGWQAQPAIASAAKDALAKASIDSIEAIGEPAMGCYAVSIALRGKGNAKELAEQLVRGLTSEDKKAKKPARKLEIKDVVKPTTDEGLMTLVFESSPYKGRLRARLGKGRITALACFGSQREPAACETACNGILGGLQ